MEFFAPASNVTPKKEGDDNLIVDLARVDEKPALYNLANKFSQQVQVPVEKMHDNKVKMDPNAPAVKNFEAILTKAQDVESSIEAALGIVAQVVKQVAQTVNSQEEAGVTSTAPRFTHSGGSQ